MYHFFTHSKLNVIQSDNFFASKSVCTLCITCFNIKWRCHIQHIVIVCHSLFRNFFILCHVCIKCIVFLAYNTIKSVYLTQVNLFCVILFFLFTSCVMLFNNAREHQQFSNTCKWTEYCVDVRMLCNIACRQW